MGGGVYAEVRQFVRWAFGGKLRIFDRIFTDRQTDIPPPGALFSK